MKKRKVMFQLTLPVVYTDFQVVKRNIFFTPKQSRQRKKKAEAVDVASVWFSVTNSRENKQQGDENKGREDSWENKKNAELWSQQKKIKKTHMGGKDLQCN